MDSETFIKQREELKQEYDVKEKKLCREYAFSNNPVNLGDIIEDDNGTRLCVTEIKYHIGNSMKNELPFCVYYGEEYTKQNRPRKYAQVKSIYQQRVVKIQKK